MTVHDNLRTTTPGRRRSRDSPEPRWERRPRWVGPAAMVAVPIAALVGVTSSAPPTTPRRPGRRRSRGQWRIRAVDR